MDPEEKTVVKRHVGLGVLPCSHIVSARALPAQSKPTWSN